MIKNGDTVVVLESEHKPEVISSKYSYVYATVIGMTNNFYKMVDENGFDIKRSKSNVYECIEDAKKQAKKEILESAESFEDSESMYLRWIKRNKEKAFEYRRYAETL